MKQTSEKEEDREKLRIQLLEIGVERKLVNPKVPGGQSRVGKAHGNSSHFCMRRKDDDSQKFFQQKPSFLHLS